MKYIFSPAALILLIAIVVAAVLFATGAWDPRDPVRRPDGVMEFTAPRMGDYRCTPAGTHYDGWPTGQGCIIVQR